MRNLPVTRGQIAQMLGVPSIDQAGAPTIIAYTYTVNFDENISPSGTSTKTRQVDGDSWFVCVAKSLALWVTTGQAVTGQIIAADGSVTNASNTAPNLSNFDTRIIGGTQTWSGDWVNAWTEWGNGREPFYEIQPRVVLPNNVISMDLRATRLPAGFTVQGQASFYGYRVKMNAPA